MRTSTQSPLRAITSAVARAVGMALLAGAGFTLVRAQVITGTETDWKNTASGSWTTGTNWSAGAPSSTITATFLSTSAAGAPTLANLGTLNVDGIVWKTGASAYTLSASSGSGTTLNIGSDGIQNYSANAQTISGNKLGITLSASTTFDVGSTGNLTISPSATTPFALGANSLTLKGSSTGVGSITSAISGTGGITKTGTGTWQLSGTNTFTGAVTVNNGTLQANATASVFGNATAVTVNANAASTTATLDLNNNSVTIGSLTLGGTGGTSTSTSNVQTGTGTLTLGGNVTYDATGNPIGSTISGNVALGGANRTFTIGNSSTATNDLTVSAVISGANNITKAGAGTLVLSGANTYSGKTSIQDGTVSVTSLANVSGGASGLGAPTSVANGTIDLGNLTTTGTLQYTGTGQTTDRVINLAGSTGGGTLDSSGSGTLTFSSNLTAAAGSKTLTLTGTNTTAAVFSGNIANGSGTVAVTKSGTGAWTLSGTNTYSGGTTLSAGTLNLNSTTALGAGGGAFTIAGGTIDNTSGGAIILSNNNAQSWNSDFTFTGSNNLNLGTGNVTLGASRLVTVNGGTLTVGGNVTGSGFNLTKAGAGTLALGGNIGTGSGSVTVNAGTLTLSGNNTYTGGTTLGASGALNVNSATALGAGSGALTISGGTLDNTSGGAVTLSNNNAQSWNGDFAFTGSNNLNLGTGNVTLGASRQVTVNAGTLTVGGNVTGSGMNLTKAGAGTLALAGNLGTGAGSVAVNAGTLTLAGNNTYTGGTTLGASGTLNVNSATALGGAAGALTISGGTLDNTSGGAVTLSNNNAQSWNGDFTFTGSNNLNLGTGNVTLGATRQVTVSANTLTVGGKISGAGGLTKAGAGTLVLSGANSQTGTTTLSAGTLTVNSGAALSGASAALVVNGGTLNLNNTAQTVTALSGSGGTVSLGSGHTFTVNTTTTDSFSGTLASSGTLTKSGTGSLTLAGNSSTYTGAVNVTNGTLVVQNNNALGTGTAGTTVSSGATLKLDGALSAVTNGTLNLTGTGYGSAGALTTGTTGDSRWANNITLGGNTTITSNTSGYLALGVTSTGYNRAISDPSGTPTDNHTLSLGGNTLTLSGSGTTYVNTRVTGTGGVTIDQNSASDTVWFTANMNTYTGTTTINKGTLSLATLYNTYPSDPAHPNFFGINGPVVIGNGTDAANSAILSIGSGSTHDELMNFTTNVTINKSGKFSLLAAQSINSLTFNGGTIDLGTTGSLYLNGTVTVNGTNAATISGTSTSSLSLTIHQGPTPVPNANRIFDITNSGGSLTVDAKINNGSITKNGAGTMTLTYNNTGGYEGTTTVNNGILSVQNSNALGQADATDTTATTVNSGGTLQLSSAANGNLTVSNEKLTLNGTGYNNSGALQNLLGTNTWAGNVVLASDSRVQSDAGTLTITGSVTSTTNANLDVRGAGNTTISGDIGTGSGGITKNDSGTLTLSGNNTYTGTTTITSGVISLQSNTGLGASSAGTTVAGTGAALYLDSTAHGNLTVIAEPLTLNGTGISGNGALRNVAGTNTFGGVITAASSTRIQNDVSGNSLTLAAGLVTSGSSGIDLNFGGTGNTTVSGNNGSGYTVNAGSSTLTKDGSGTLALSLTGTSAQNQVGNTHLNAGTLKVAAGTLNTGTIDSVAGSTLAIASGAQVTANYASGTTIFSGVISDVGGDGGGTFKKTGAGTLVFGSSFNAGTSSTLILDGGTLKLGNTSGVSVTFDTIHITANTTLDFNASYATTLSSSKLVIDAGVQVNVINWVSLSDVWYATSTVNGNTGSIMDLLNQSPLNQITFAGNSNMATTWVTTQGGQYFNREIRPTPEPSTYGAILLGASLALLGWRRYRRQSPAKAAAPLAALRRC